MSLDHKRASDIQATVVLIGFVLVCAGALVGLAVGEPIATVIAGGILIHGTWK